MLSLDGNTAWNLGSAVFETWSRSDLPGMFDWLEKNAGELPSEGHRESAGFNLAKAAWRLDAERGIRLVRLLKPGGQYLWNLYNQWAEHDPAAASTRVLHETDEKIRDNVIVAVAVAWAPRDPMAAKAWAEKIPDPFLAQKTVIQIGGVLGRSDPHAGADYLAQIPQTNDARAALKETVATWAERDLDGALDWAATLENVPLGDWVAGIVAAKLPQDRRVKAEQRWRELRSTTPGGPSPIKQ